MAARGILPSNGRRIVRALEVIEVSGQPFTATLPRYESVYPAVQLGLRVPRAELDERIAQRVDRMWQAGFVAEVRRLEQAGLRAGRTASRALGYAQVLRFLAGEWTERAGPGGDDPGHPAVRPPPGGLVPPRSQGDLAGRRARGGPAPAGAGYDQHMRFGKGHGTENDFVILPDPGNTLDLRASLVARLCDRRAGLGADGVLRVVRTAELPDGRGGAPEWFMDYRNADGSIAEMCGNGVRVFARYLLDHGLASGPAFGWPPGPGSSRCTSSRTAGSPWTWARSPCSGPAGPCSAVPS